MAHDSTRCWFASLSPTSRFEIEALTYITRRPTVPAAEGVASPRRQRVGAHDVPGETAGVALQLEASTAKLAEATELWLLERPGSCLAW